MQARGPLMAEHRMIEQMISIAKRALTQIEATRTVDPVFVDTTVDFFRVYADRTHHGKEEDIFFRELGRRHLTSEDRLVMQELIEEHVFGRQIVNALDEANTRYRKGDASALADVSNMLRTLVEFYPEHIVKEDKVFFPVSRDYFTDKEDQLLLAEFWEFDRKIIHEKYKSVIEALQTQ